MNLPSWLYNPWVWGGVTLVSFGLCTWLPPRLADPVLRRRVTYFLLMPLCVLLIVYVYPVGIEFCRRLAVGWGK